MGRARDGAAETQTPVFLSMGCPGLHQQCLAEGSHGRQKKHRAPNQGWHECHSPATPRPGLAPSSLGHLDVSFPSLKHGGRADQCHGLSHITTHSGDGRITGHTNPRRGRVPSVLGCLSPCSHPAPKALMDPPRRAAWWPFQPEVEGL